MQFEPFLVERKDGMAVITFNRPEKLNAINAKMRVEFLNALDNLEVDDDVKVVIVTGAGHAFCAGADITELETDLSKIRRGSSK